MVNSNANALGIIFPNSYDGLVPELVTERLMASIPFAGRYRMVDFILSSMVNCGIDNVSLIVRKNYHSLMDHLGSGKEWDLHTRNNGLFLLPPFVTQETGGEYLGVLPAIGAQQPPQGLLHPIYFRTAGHKGTAHFHGQVYKQIIIHTDSLSLSLQG